MNVGRSKGTIMYYVHFFGKLKSDDMWVPDGKVRYLSDYSLIRSLGAEATGGLWPGFFALSQLSKQTTPGSSVYGPSSSSAHPDPHEYSPKTVAGVDLGNAKIKAWYRSPFPREVWCTDTYLGVCSRCLCYGLPPSREHECQLEIGGEIVYASGRVSVYEVDGMDRSEFSERLFLLAKLFLEDKRTSTEESSQISQVTPFLFYVLMEKDLDSGQDKFVGYFSKYKVQKKDGPILSCILVLPSEQKKGYGKLLISIAYELAKREGRMGSAERPLSGPGLAAFLSWWSWKLRTVVEKCYDGEVLTLAQLSGLSGMTSEDVVETLRNCGAIKQWGSSSSAGDVKLRESGKRAKIKLTLETLRALEKKSPRTHRFSQTEFDPKSLSDSARICQIAQTPPK